MITRTRAALAASALASLVWLGHAPASAAETKTAPADTIAALCVTDGERQDVCTCASAEFKRVADKDDVVTYSDVSRRYLAYLKDEKPRIEAWDNAIGAVAIKKRVTPLDLADRTNVLKQKYKAAVQQCAEATAAIPAPAAPTP